MKVYVAGVVAFLKLHLNCNFCSKLFVLPLLFDGTNSGNAIFSILLHNGHTISHSSKPFSNLASISQFDKLQLL